MTLSEAAELVISAKSQKKGIDKDSRDLIGKMVKEGNLTDVETANCYYLCETAGRILRIKKNDYFDPKSIATLFLKKAQGIAEDASDFKHLIKYVIYIDDDEYTGGLNDQVWARDLLRHYCGLGDYDAMDVIEIANHISYCLPEKSREVLQLATPTTMWQAASIATSYMDYLDDKDVARSVLKKALADKLTTDEQSSEWVQELMTKLSTK